MTLTDTNLGLSNYPVRVIAIEEDDTGLRPGAREANRRPALRGVIAIRKEESGRASNNIFASNGSLRGSISRAAGQFPRHAQSRLSRLSFAMVQAQGCQGLTWTVSSDGRRRPRTPSRCSACASPAALACEQSIRP